MGNNIPGYNGQNTFKKSNEMSTGANSKNG